MKSLPRLLILLALFSLTEPARAVGIALAPPAFGPGSQITFTVALDAATSINGYDVTISWDAGELSFLSATELSGLGFDVAPSGSTPAGERVATFALTAVSATDLFAVSFDILAGVLADGAYDFQVFVAPANGSGLIPGSIDNSTGAGFDVVPEPSSGALLALGLLALAWRGKRRPDR